MSITLTSTPHRAIHSSQYYLYEDINLLGCSLGESPKKKLRVNKRIHGNSLYSFSYKILKFSQYIWSGLTKRDLLPIYKCWDMMVSSFQSLASESSHVHKIFTLFKQASYLRYHPEYKKPATKFPVILNSFLTKVQCGSTVSGEPLHGWRWGRWEGKGIL